MGSDRWVAGWWSSVWGSSLTIRRFNRLPPEQATEMLQRCLPVDRWVRTLVDARPFRGMDDLVESGRDAAFPFTPAELEAALACYLAPTVVPPTRRIDSRAEIRVRQHLLAGIESYERKFGRPFLVRTSGRLPAEILVQLWTRLGNDVDTEDKVLAQQLREIALVRLAEQIID